MKELPTFQNKYDESLFLNELKFWKIGRHNRRDDNQKVKFDEDDMWDDYVSPPEDAMPIEAMGQQWYWSFRLPGEDGILGTTDARNINADNPFGMNKNDPNGQDDILIEGDDLHLEHDKPVKFLLRSIDVLHNFYVPQFRAKMDLVPGMVTFYWIKPTVTGNYDFAIVLLWFFETAAHLLKDFL